ncbi:MAG: AAA family ATPase [Methanobacteriaceae archaeon]|nr:AAA family ATPase [Methanobacteriaceae archaeon]
MIIIITGTPGTGKTTISSKLAENIGAELVPVNKLAENENLFLGTDPKRGYQIVDIGALDKSIDDIKKRYNDNEIIIVEGHLAQDYPNADMIIVLRCQPDILNNRLNRRNWSHNKIKENVSAEILGICSSESYESYGDIVQEIDTSKNNIDECVTLLKKIILGDISYPIGEIDYLMDYCSFLD